MAEEVTENKEVKEEKEVKQALFLHLIMNEGMEGVRRESFPFIGWNKSEPFTRSNEDFLSFVTVGSDGKQEILFIPKEHVIRMCIRYNGVEERIENGETKS